MQYQKLKPGVIYFRKQANKSLKRYKKQNQMKAQLK